MDCVNLHTPADFFLKLSRKTIGNQNKYTLHQYWFPIVVPVPDSIESRSGFRRAGNQQQPTGLVHLNGFESVHFIGTKKREA